jgi:hypothetical protein
MQEFGDDDPKEVEVTLEKNDVRVLTGSLRLICVRDPELPILAIKAVHAPYQPLLERQKSRALTLRYLWQFFDHIGMNTPPVDMRNTLRSTLDDVFDRLATHNQERQAAHARNVERRDFTRIWDGVLKLQRTLLDGVLKLPYTRISRDGNTITFFLAEPAPDDLAWPDSAPIAVINQQKQRQLFVGTLMSVSGKRVQIAWSPPGIQEHAQSFDDPPPSGLLSVYQQEALAALDRQRWALNTLMSGGTVNPRLPEVLLDPTSALFEEVDDQIEFYQQSLADDKKNAVRQALAAQDIFLLQGPPGTGKTTTLAEIILQILKIKPDARILVSSQSNVAVNHVLSRVAELRTGTHTEIVRIGRPEKIGQGAEEWTLEQRMDTWRSEVLQRTDLVLKELRAQMRQQDQQRKASDSLSEGHLDDLVECQSWLEELVGDMDELTEVERQLAMLTQRLSSPNAYPTKQREEQTLEHQACEIQVEQRTAYITSILALVRSYLPESMQQEALPSLAEERKRLYVVVTNLLPTDDETHRAQSREAKLFDLVKRWRRVFGKQDDFAGPILERANILAATCLITGGHYLKDEEFDWAIIDEAGRATAPELLVPLVRARRSIIVGDERQLPHPLQRADHGTPGTCDSRKRVLAGPQDRDRHR